MKNRAERLAYSLLNLKPWEFERLTVREFEMMIRGYDIRMRIEDSKRAFFFCMATNVHLKKSSQIKPRDVMKALYPMTARDRMIEEMQFIEEWEAKGGELDGNE